MRILRRGDHGSGLKFLSCASTPGVCRPSPSQGESSNDYGAIALALNILRTFDLRGHSVMEFVRRCVVRFLDHDSPYVASVVAPLGCVTVLLHCRNKVGISIYSPPSCPQRGSTRGCPHMLSSTVYSTPKVTSLVPTFSPSLLGWDGALAMQRCVYLLVVATPLTLLLLCPLCTPVQRVRRKPQASPSGGIHQRCCWRSAVTPVACGHL